ncbi:MAG: acyl-CoA dehydrogenase family protein [Gluconacetobacter diazotrophicus]|nr:acyl-CoA dehydrogenase family protein [Gluconacetobacter diazotrophicus]
MTLPRPIPGDPVHRFLFQLAAAVPMLAAEADREDGFPARGLAILRDAGALSAPLPAAAGGLDLGCDRQGLPAARFMRSLGRAGIGFGRLLEGHLNALRLVRRYGTDGQMRDAARAAADGILFALWVTDGDRPLAVRDGVLSGGKAFCSGAGHAGRALVTARSAAGDTFMHLVDVSGLRPSTPRLLSGVRGAVTADMPLDDVPAAAPVGAPGDYLRQPEFSAGAWRGSAIACGALEALVDDTVAALRARNRHRAPHQAARIGRLLIARDTAIAWVDRAATAADGNDPGHVAATVNLSRIAVEAACLDAVPLVQRALGLQAMASGTRIERVLRDLATYLRQPAPDETLEEAALWFADHPFPDAP